MGKGRQGGFQGQQLQEGRKVRDMVQSKCKSYMLVQCKARDIVIQCKQPNRILKQDCSGEMTGEEEDSRGLASFGWTREGEKSISSDGCNCYEDEKLLLPSVKHDLNALICFRCKAEDSCLYPHPR